MARLEANPKGLLVSAETVKDFQLATGDTMKLRLQDGRTKQYKVVDFIYLGVTHEFPTAPSDSFMVANAKYIAEQTGSLAVGTFLVDTAPSDSTLVATRLQKVVGTSAIVKDIASDRRKIGNRLTAVELGGLPRLNLALPSSSPPVDSASASSPAGESPT